MAVESPVPRTSHVAARGRHWFLAALLLTTAVSALLLLLPLSAGQVNDQPVHHRSMLTAEGPAIILPLAVPVLVCLVPLLAPARRRRAAAWGSAAILGVGAVISLLSIGVFFVPTAVLLAIGAARSRS